MSYFLPLYSSNRPKIQNFKKWKTHLEISSFYVSVPKIMIICYTVPEIWRLRHVMVVFHFWLIFALLHPPPPPASPVTAQKVKISKKRKKKTPRHIIFNISLPKIMIICFTYCSWDMVPYICNCYLSFGAIFFCLFTPLTSLSNSRQHLANANIIADVKSKIITPSWHFLVDMVFSATSKVQNYQNKTEVKSLSPSKHMLATYFKEF